MSWPSQMKASVSSTNFSLKPHVTWSALASACDLTVVLGNVQCYLFSNRIHISIFMKLKTSIQKKKKKQPAKWANKQHTQWKKNVVSYSSNRGLVSRT